eukprot:Em0003g240a
MGTLLHSLSRSAATVYDSFFLTTGYKVTVSALTNGPIPVDSTLTVTLFCTIDPTPPMPLSYVWYSSAPGNYINNQGPSATVYIFPRERKLSLYFCHVQSNGSDVAVGYISIKPQGFLIPIGPTVVTYHYGDNIALEVSLSSNPRAQYIQSLQWYKDGNPLPVNCSSDMGVCTNTTGTRLTIQRAGNPDSPVIVITCAALNGTPDVHNITLMKNESVLETVVGGNTLSYTVTWSGLGQYVCEVDSLYSTHQESIVLMESGSHDAEQAMAKLQLMSCENLAHLCQNEGLGFRAAPKARGTRSICTRNPNPVSKITRLAPNFFSNVSAMNEAEVKVETIIGGIVGGIALTTCIGAIVIYSIAKVRKSHDTVNEMHRVDFRRMALRNIILVEADDNPAYYSTIRL